MSKAVFYTASDTPVGGLFRGDGNRLVNGRLAVTYSLESYRRPDAADSTERVVGRWHSPDLDVTGRFGGNNQGSIAVGQGYLLLTDRFLRGTVTGSGPKNRVLTATKGGPKLKSFSGTYAFLFDLVTDLAEFDGHSKAVALSSQDAGLLITDPYVADENWKYRPFALPGKRTIELATALLGTILQAKRLYGDEQTSQAAAMVADSDWRNRLADSGRTPFTVKFGTGSAG
jgi:hypothetical protein